MKRLFLIGFFVLLAPLADAAIVVRYFSTSAAGAGDGTTWANRAALFDGSGNWASVITGFAFNGSDALEARVGPGSYTCSQTLASTLFTNAPTAANPLFIFGADSSGNRITIPDTDWISPMPAFDTTGFPVINCTLNSQTSTLGNVVWRMIVSTSSVRQSGDMFTAGSFDWCSLVNSASNTSATVANGVRVTNSVLSCTGSAYSYILQVGGITAHNVRLVGVAGSTGNRYGLQMSNGDNDGTSTMITIVGVGGSGVFGGGTGTTRRFRLAYSTVVNCGGSGILLAATAGQTTQHFLHGLYIANCGAYGVNGQSASYAFMSRIRTRDNVSGAFNGVGNYPTDLDSYSIDSDDTTEFVDAAGGDYRIKSTATNVWGKGFGAGDESSSGSAAVEHSFIFAQ